MARRLGVFRAAVVAMIVVAALFAFSGTAMAADNSACLTCHAAFMSMPVPDVNRDTACKSCHVGGLVGTHPYHQAGSNCGSACHPGWGDSLMTAVPAYTDPVSGASFTSSTSKATSPAVLHIIHSDARWPQNVDASFSACASCHAPAACTACHTGAVSVQHTNHSATGNASYQARAPWTGMVAHGVTGGDQTQHTAGVETNQCASAGCHDIEGTKANRPFDVEDYNYTVGQNPDDPAGSSSAITLTGAWRYKASSVYTGSRMSYNNVAGSALTATFTGRRVDLVSDKDPYRGKADVYIDGAKVATIDTYSASTVYQAVMYSSDTLSSGSHTISVRPLNQKNTSARAAYVVVDSFRVYSNVPDSIAPTCLSCHGDKSSGHGGTFSHEATHTVGTESGFACTECHSMNMFTEHGRASSKTAGSSCAACHTTYAPYTLAAYDFTCGGTPTKLDGAPQPCHNNTGQQKHDFVDGNHDASAGANGADCKGCHGTDLSVIHTEGSARPYNARLSANSYTTNCLTCHSAASFPATKDCTSSMCHNASFGGAAVTMDNHVPVAHPATNNGQASVARTGGLACSTCHTMELAGEHAKTSSLTDPGAAQVTCSSCHSASYLPTTWFDTPGTTNTCIACHGVGSGAPSASGAGEPHEAADYATKHNWSATSAGCSGFYCHNVTAIDAIHDTALPGNGSCQSCHTTPNAVPAVDACIDCHAAHPDEAAVHNPNGTPARTTANADCVTCHTEQLASVSAYHPGGCAGCHNNSKLTKYLQNNYDLICTDCHNATMEIGYGQVKAYYDYTFSSKSPTYESTHYDTYAGSHAATGMATAIANKTCSNCHASSLKAEHLITVSSGSVQCFDCHTSSAPVNAISVINANWVSDTCAECHGANHGATGLATHDLSASATALGCAASGCHTANTGDIATLHLNALDGTGNTSCNVCHTNADTNLTAITGCDSCHAGHDMTVHQVTTDTGNCLRCHGNDGTPANDVRGVHATCATCHDNASYPGIVTGKTSDCVGCHNAALVADPHAGSGGSYSPYDPSHYVGTESTHTVSAAQAATLYDGFACSACHKSEMKPEHFKTSSLFADVPGTYADKCVSCHEVKVDTIAWNTTCDVCHGATPHTERNTKHDVSASACTGVGCHDVDISVIHDNSITTNIPTPDCQTCHTDNNAVPTELDCGATGCHAGMTAHGHTLATSTYNNTTVTGCTDSGAGCHGVAPANYQEIHPNSGCTSGACHTAANHNDAQFNDPNTCMNCHGGGATLYAGAPDVVGLLDTGTTGHYNETTHTATGMTSVVRGTTNGTASATCTNCHNGVSAGPDGFYAQHQGVRTGSMTCSDCHNKNAAIQTLVTDATRTDTCVACHTGSVLGATEVQHATANAPAVLATSSLSCGATGTNCHTSYDLHELHKDAAGCNLTGCHDYATQGVKPTGKTCGQVGGCHTTFAVNSHALATDAAKHLPTITVQASSATFYSTACGACHDIRNSNSSLTLEHNLATSAKTTNATNVCLNCHNNTASTTAIQANWSAKDTTTACAQCHTGALSIHADTNPTAHSDVTSAGCSSSGIGCHNTSDLSQVGVTNVVNTNIHSTCLRCHDRTATAPNLAYNPANDTCGSGRECHATAGQYNTTTFVHNGGGGLADGTDATHHTDTVMTGTMTQGVATATCANCHSGTLATAHATSLTGWTNTCTSCHNSTLGGNVSANEVKAGWTNNDCGDCHVAGASAVKIPNMHSGYGTAVHQATSTAGCGASGTNCHTTYDLAVLHGATQTSGCQLAGCHDSVDKAMGSATKTCGQTGGCHATYTANSHAHAADAAKHQPTTLTQANATTFASTACGACHDIRNSNSSLTLEHTLSTSAKTTNATNVCLNCHNNAASTTAIQGNWATKDTTSACSTCHTGALAIHADTNPTAHSDVTSAGCSSSGVGCHNTSDLSQVGVTNVVNTNIHSTCLRCHDRTATAPNLAYNPANDTCGSGRECHATAGQYNTTTFVHNGGGGLADGDDATHHTATGMTTKVDGTTYDTGGGNTCADCHSATLKTSHATSSVGAVSCSTGGTGNVGCHNSTAIAAAKTQVKASWTNDACADCHTTSHTTYTTGTHTALLGTTGVADGCANAGCHNTGATNDVRVIHNRAKVDRGCTSIGTDSNGWSGSCHDLNKAMTSGTIGCGSGTTATTACHVNHTNGNHMPAHDATNATSIGCTTSGCHETLSVTTIHAGVGDGCQPCHGGGGYTDIHTLPTANPTRFECTGCHNGTLVGTHVYTPHDANHYATASHDSSLTTGATFGNTNGQALTDYHGTTLTWSRQCTTCHSIDMKTEHFKTSSAFPSVPGTYSDKCIACHELRVDNMGAAWTGSCSGDAAACHSLANGTLHNNWGTKHDASAVTIPSPGLQFTGGTPSVQTVFTEDFGTSTTFPSAWTLESTAYIRNQNTRSHAGYAAEIYATSTTRRTFGFYRDVDLSTATGNATLSFWQYCTGISGGTDYQRVEYSTNGGGTWTQLYNTTASVTTWTQRTYSTIPTGGVVRIRFSGSVSSTTDFVNFDDIQLTANITAAPGWGSSLPANSTAAVSCMNNPNSTQCHDVTDVSDIHSSISGRSDNGCPICHVNNAAVPTTLACQTSGCHVGINGSGHDTTWHESPISNTALFGTGFVGSWCTGCHDDSIDNEHYALGAYASQACSLCHKKTANSAAPTNVTAANTATAIHGDSTAGNALCTQCHTTVTKAAVHVQRMGTTTTLGSTQFDDTWSGHRIYDSMYGSRTGGTTSTFNGQATSITWSLPTNTSWLKTGWTNITAPMQVVRCSDCHGTMTGATGPHGSAMAVNIASGYDNSYSDGTLTYTSGNAMSNTTNICAKCHTTTAMGYNNVHSRTGDHAGIACIACHSKTPHAWKRPRLIGYTTDPAPYQSTLVTGISQRSYTPTGWQKGYCGATGACNTHTQPGTVWP